MPSAYLNVIQSIDALMLNCCYYDDIPVCTSIHPHPHRHIYRLCDMYSDGEGGMCQLPSSLSVMQGWLR